MVKFWSNIVLISALITPAFAEEPWTPDGNWFFSTANYSRAVPWSHGQFRFIGDDSTLYPAKGYLISVADTPVLMQSLNEDYNLPISGYNRVIWEQDTMRVYAGYGIGIYPSVPRDTSFTWGQLREYFYWKVEDTRLGQSFFAPCSLGNPNTRVVIPSGRLAGWISYGFLPALQDMPIPKSDSTVYRVGLHAFNTMDTTGTILYSFPAMSVIRRTAETPTDSLIWYISTRPFPEQTSVIEAVARKMPNSQMVWHYLLSEAYSSEEYDLAIEALRHLNFLIEHRINSTMSQEDIENPDAYRRRLAQNYIEDRQLLQSLLIRAQQNQ